MTSRARLRPALMVLATQLAKRYGLDASDVALLRLLRDFGVECFELGAQRALPAADAVTVRPPRKDER